MSTSDKTNTRHFTNYFKFGTCIHLLLPLQLICSCAFSGVVGATDYSLGFIWNRAVDWTISGDIPGQSNKNDSQSKPVSSYNIDVASAFTAPVSAAFTAITNTFPPIAYANTADYGAMWWRSGTRGERVDQ
jgi:hypothetical protein